MLTLYLIRHGEKQKATPDPELTDVGHHQAKKTGEFLLARPITQIVASPMIRTQQTAAYIATALDLEILSDARLKERMDYGDYKQTTFDAFVKEWKKATQHRDYTPQWGDSSLSTGKRITHLIEEIDEERHKHVALVTHGGAIADFLKYIFDMDVITQKLPNASLQNDLNIKECSITTVVKKGKEYELSECHFLSHLE